MLKRLAGRRFELSWLHTRSPRDQKAFSTLMFVFSMCAEASEQNQSARGAFEHLR